MRDGFRAAVARRGATMPGGLALADSWMVADKRTCVRGGGEPPSAVQSKELALKQERGGDRPSGSDGSPAVVPSEPLTARYTWSGRKSRAVVSGEQSIESLRARVREVERELRRRAAGGDAESSGTESVEALRSRLCELERELARRTN